MREIKFRAWDKKLGRMLKKSDVHEEAHCLAIFLDGEIRDVAFGRIDEGPINDDFILMQFTGLRDKNGKEIYEGDVIYHETAAEDDAAIGYGMRAEVIWDEEKAGFSAIDYDFGENILTCYSIEAIGNIYENGNLLEKK